MLRRSFAHTAHVCHTLSSLGVKPFARSAPVLSKSQLNLKMRDSSAPALARRAVGTFAGVKAALTQKLGEAFLNDMLYKLKEAKSIKESELLSSVGELKHLPLMERPGIDRVRHALSSGRRGLYLVNGPGNSGKTYSITKLVAERASPALYLPLRQYITLDNTILRALELPAGGAGYESSMPLHQALDILDKIVAACNSTSEKPIVLVVDNVQTCLRGKPTPDSVSLIGWLVEQVLNHGVQAFMLASADVKEELGSISGVTSRLEDIEFGYPDLDKYTKEIEAALGLKSDELATIRSAVGNNLADITLICHDASKPGDRSANLKEAISRRVERYQSRLNRAMLCDATMTTAKQQRDVMPHLLADLCTKGTVDTWEVLRKYPEHELGLQKAMRGLVDLNLARRGEVPFLHLYSEGVRSAYKLNVVGDPRLSTTA